MKKLSLLLVANGHEAKIFNKSGAKKIFDLRLISELKADLDSNHEKSGTTFNSVGSLRHGIEPHTDRREVERQKFAEMIAENLTKIEKDKPYDDLVIVVSHQISEELEKALNNNLKQKISHKLTKDLVKLSVEELKEHLIDL